jgi:hypothetical protein
LVFRDLADIGNREVLAVELDQCLREEAISSSMFTRSVG